MTTSKGILRRSFLGDAWISLIGLLSGSAIVKAATTSAPATSSVPPTSSSPIYLLEFSAFQNKTPDQNMQEIMDREEIRELLGRYAHQTARGMNVSTLYTEDGAFIVRIPGRPAQEIRGREALSKTYGTMATMENPPKPQIHNSLLVISGDEATGICSNEVRVVENGQSIIGSGYYEDRFRRVNGRWKFVVRSATFFHWVPIQQGWANSNHPV
jgi:ketosteroid isomerase-like protein